MEWEDKRSLCNQILSMVNKVGLGLRARASRVDSGIRDSSRVTCSDDGGWASKVTCPDSLFFVILGAIYAGSTEPLCIVGL